MMKKTTVGIAAILTTQMAMAQSFPPPPPPPDMESFNTPPPPAFNDFSAPPPADTGAAGAAGTGGAASIGGDATSGGKSGTLSKKQQSKFAKAGLEDITNENFPETIESFDFPNVEITDVINAISSLTGKNFIIDPGVRGKITIVAPSKITVAEAYKAFLSALAINGFTVVPSGSFLKIKSARNAQRDSIETYSGEYYPNSDQMITRIIHLKHISADQVNRELRILSSKDGEMSVYSATNSLILSDYGSNIDRVMKIISQLDVPGFDEQLEVIRIKYAKAKDLADLVDKIVNKGAKGAAGGAVPGAFSAGVPRFTRSTSSNGQQGASFMAIPDDRTNSIIVVGNKAGILRMRTLIARLDTRISLEEAGGVFVYYVKNGDAKKIAATLQGVTKDAAPKPATGGFGGAFGGMGGNPLAAQSAEIFGGDVKIQADETTNALVITASKPDYEMVKRILDQIDVARDQVFVESIIMEMSNKTGDNWGLGYYQFAEGGGKSGFASNAVNISELIGPAVGAGATLGFATGNKVTITDPISKVSTEIKSLVGFINFIKQTTKANILSTPQIIAMDSQEATIEVGDKVATKIERSVSANGTETVTPTLEEATIKLVIKPFISPKAETVRMEIQQTVMQPTQVTSQAKVLSDNSQPLAKRYIKTMLVVKNQDTAVLGGLMRDNETEKITKVPLLGDLPIIGWLFKGREASKEKVNLLVFLTPKIIRNPGDQKMVLNKKLDERLKFIKAQGGKDVYGETIDQITKKTSQRVDDNNGE